MEKSGYATSVIEKATVYLHGVEITRKAHLLLKQGKNTVVFGQLPARLNAQSVRAESGLGAELLNTNFKINYMVEAETSQHLQELNSQLDETEDKITQNNDKISVLDEEEEFLRENRHIGGKEGIKAIELKNINEYYHARLSDIKTEKFMLVKETKELEQERDRILRELGTLRSKEYNPIGEITLELNAVQDAEVELWISYFTSEASWTPAYEIRVLDTESPVRLTFKGEVKQNTGENWDEVPLILSSGMPTAGASQPELKPWYLDVQKTVPILARQQSYQSFNKPMMSKMADLAGGMAPMEDEEVMYAPEQQAEINQNQTSVEFALNAPVTVLSSDQPAVADIATYKLKATYQHYSVRKLDRDVFLLALVEDWEQLNLLEGEVSIFLGNSFIGNTYLDPRKASEVMEISLGRDKSVIVTRTKGKDFASKTIGGNHKAVRSWELTARNTKNNTVSLKLMDQVPVSVNSAVKVEIIDTSAAKYNKETGELVWELKLEPAQAITKTIKYEVTYPKDQTVVLE